MSLNQPQLDALADLLSESLRARSGEPLTPEVIDERARNAAQLLSVCYEMRPLTERGERRCYDPACRFFGQRHGGLHEPQEVA